MSNLLFDLAFQSIKRAGFNVNPDIDEKDLFDRWSGVHQYYPDNIAALYIALGDQTPQKPYRNFSDDCWHFDCEAIEGTGSYVRILKNLSRISKGDLDFQDCTDYCNDDEDDKAWVSFQFEGENIHWELKVDDDWVDGNFFNHIQALCKKHNKKGRLTFYPEGQGFVTSYLTQEEFQRFQTTAALKLEWLNFKEDGQYS